MMNRAPRSAVRAFARNMTMPAAQFKGEKDPAFLEFQSTAAIENMYEFKIRNAAQYNVELRKLADLKVNNKLKSTFEVMKSKLIKPDATTIEILMKSAEPANHRRAILLFDDILKFELDPTADTYKTMSSIFTNAKEPKCAELCTAMAKDEDRYGSERMAQLVEKFHAIAKQ